MDTFYFTITGPILDESVAQLMQALQQVANQPNINHIYLAISTPGGSVNAGITLYHFLRSLPVKITTHNIGQVDSIGSVIFLGGEERFASSATSFLLHGVTLTSNGPTQMSSSQLIERSSQLKQDEERIMTITTERTQLTKQKMKKFFKEGSSLSPGDAKKEGIVTDIKEFSIPDTAPNGLFNSFPQPLQSNMNISNINIELNS